MTNTSEGRASGEGGLAAAWNGRHYWIRARGGVSHCEMCGLTKVEVKQYGLLLCPGGQHTNRGRLLKKGARELVIFEHGAKNMRCETRTRRR